LYATISQAYYESEKLFFGYAYGITCDEKRSQYFLSQRRNQTINNFIHAFINHLWLFDRSPRLFKKEQLMDANYWNGFAHEYHKVVTDAFTYGRGRTIEDFIDRIASPDRTAADFGCGTGKMLPFLAQKFHGVYGYDFSEKLLEYASERCRKIQNVQIAQVDLSEPVKHLPMVDMAISLNAAIMPDNEKRERMLKGIVSRIKPGGHLIFVVPSVESILYIAFRDMEFHIKKGLPAKEAALQVDLSSLTDPRQMAQGVLARGGEPTKHYLKEELTVLVKSLKLELLEITKVEYAWTTELDSVPRWMREPYPWDWLVFATLPVKE
jgi:SAM-dependent methyltransferase